MKIYVKPPFSFFRFRAFSGAIVGQAYFIPKKTFLYCIVLSRKFLTDGKTKRFSSSFLMVVKTKPNKQTTIKINFFLQICFTKDFFHCHLPVYTSDNFKILFVSMDVRMSQDKTSEIGWNRVTISSKCVYIDKNT